MSNNTPSWVPGARPSRRPRRVFIALIVILIVTAVALGATLIVRTRGAADATPTPAPLSSLPRGAARLAVGTFACNVGHDFAFTLTISTDGEYAISAIGPAPTNPVKAPRTVGSAPPSPSAAAPAPGQTADPSSLTGLTKSSGREIEFSGGTLEGRTGSLSRDGIKIELESTFLGYDLPDGASANCHPVF